MGPVQKKYGDGGDGRDLGLKRQRIIDQPPSFYGAPPGSSFMCSASPPPPPSYAYSAQPPPPFSVVRLRGLPFDCTEPDIIEFFSGLDIVDILLVNKDGRAIADSFLKENSQSIRAIVRNAAVGASSKLIDSLPKLEIVSSYSVGLDKIDLNKCNEKGFRVSNTPDVLTDDVAGLAIALILSTLRRICESDRYVRSGLRKKGDFKLSTKPKFCRLSRDPLFAELDKSGRHRPYIAHLSKPAQAIEAESRISDYNQSSSVHSKRERLLNYTKYNEVLLPPPLPPSLPFLLVRSWLAELEADVFAAFARLKASFFEHGHTHNKQILRSCMFKYKQMLRYVACEQLCRSLQEKKRDFIPKS
ncbi:hypothetical protein IFM89_005842 [Coptis chinensis]|uniref:D-isomer specific 2-hydroxyacid dehydrogenase catalytic domain-containing protein n=1 Tax=Coptis chinensis TaxID=261450 RepID=A0A835GXN8_9MAGN|nr:hypothetical protein IFM89_005842 [Coptis chinensis]